MAGMNNDPLGLLVRFEEKNGLQKVMGQEKNQREWRKQYEWERRMAQYKINHWPEEQETKIRIERLEGYYWGISGNYWRLEKRLERLERIIGGADETLERNEEKDTSQLNKGFQVGLNETPNVSISIQELIETLHTFKTKIDETVNEINNYLNCLRDEEYNEKLNESEDQAIKKVESVYDRLDEMKRRNGFSNEKLTDLFNKMKDLVRKQKDVINYIENDEIRLAIKHNELVDVLIELEERKLKKANDLNQRKKIGLLKEKIDVGLKQKMKGIIHSNEIEQLEYWTGMKIGKTVFDSNIDDCREGTSVFNQRIINQSNLIFLIEDESGNLFGGYISTNIYFPYPFTFSWVNDPNSFVFSLKSNGRLNGMLKFDCIVPQHSFFVADDSDPSLFAMGYGEGLCDIYVEKNGSQRKSYCVQKGYNYGQGLNNALCGSQYFIPHRVIVIQMI